MNEYLIRLLYTDESISTKSEYSGAIIKTNIANQLIISADNVVTDGWRWHFLNVDGDIIISIDASQFIFLPLGKPLTNLSTATSTFTSAASVVNGYDVRVYFADRTSTTTNSNNKEQEHIDYIEMHIDADNIVSTGKNLLFYNGSTLAITGGLTSTGNAVIGGTLLIGPSTVSGNEGGEIQIAQAPSSGGLTGSAVNVDIYTSKLRIFESGGNARGVYIDLSKAPDTVGGELTWKVSGYVNAGSFLQIDNLKLTVTTGGNRGLSVGAVSTSFLANISGWYGFTGGGGGSSANSVTYTTTAANSAFGWNFGAEGDGSNYTINDKTNNRVYRVTLMIGASYLNNFISIERLL